MEWTGSRMQAMSLGRQDFPQRTVLSGPPWGLEGGENRDLLPPSKRCQGRVSRGPDCQGPSKNPNVRSFHGAQNNWRSPQPVRKKLVQPSKKES